MLQNNQIVEGHVSFVDEEQLGILRIGKDTIYVRHVLVHEFVKVKILKRIQKGYSAQLLQVVKASPMRCKVLCPIYERCGSCQMLHMNAQAQRIEKKRSIERLCKASKGLTLHVQDIKYMEEPYHYRNKVIVGFRKDRTGHMQAGFYEAFSHTIIPYKTCLLHPPICDEIISTIVKLMMDFRIEPYEEDKRCGFMRHVLLRYSETSKQVMVVLIVNHQVFPARKNFVQALLKAHPVITCVIQNINTRKTSVVLGEHERVLYGSNFLEDTLCGLRFRISPRSFYQINHQQTEVLYTLAIRALHLKGNETVLDAYCGIGTIAMFVARFVKQVIGVEINKEAIGDAKVNAGINHIHNIRFVCDDAGKFMARLAANKEKLDIVIMDPPRSGSSEAFIKSLVRVGPNHVLYISCNPQTLIRDLEVFKKYAYHVSGEIMPVDLFPQTFHVESVVLMSRKDK